MTPDRLKRILSHIGATIVVAILILATLCSCTIGFSFEDARKVKPGMTKAEVIGIMGKPKYASNLAEDKAHSLTPEAIDTELWSYLRTEIANSFKQYLGGPDQWWFRVVFRKGRVESTSSSKRPPARSRNVRIYTVRDGRRSYSWVR